MTNVTPFSTLHPDVHSSVPFSQVLCDDHTREVHPMPPLSTFSTSPCASKLNNTIPPQTFESPSHRHCPWPHLQHISPLPSSLLQFLVFNISSSPLLQHIFQTSTLSLLLHLHLDNTYRLRSFISPCTTIFLNFTQFPSTL